MTVSRALSVSIYLFFAAVNLIGAFTPGGPLPDGLSGLAAGFCLCAALWRWDDGA